MAVVDDLVTREETGILEVYGNPSGAIYLDGGRIAYARASWVPGLAARLRAIVPSLTGTGEPWPGEDADNAALALLAVQHGYLSLAGLHELIGSVVAEAFLVLTIPLGADFPLGATHFTPGPADWTDLFPRLGLDVVRGEAVRRSLRMAACGLAPTTAVAPRDLAAPSAVLTREQWALACQIGDRASALELAMRRGASLSDTVHCLGSLVRAGLCVPVKPVRRWQRRTAHVPASPAVPADASSIAPPTAPQPTQPAASSPDFPTAESRPVRVPRDPAWRPARPVQPPSPEVLRQVLNALRKL